MADVIAAAWAILVTFFAFCWYVISSAWYLLSWIPILGGMIQTVVLVVVVVGLYRIAPPRIQVFVSAVWDKVQKHLPAWLAEPIRWFRWILSTSNRTERPQARTTYQKRTFKQNLRLRLFWFSMGAVCLALIEHKDVVESWVRLVLD